MRPWKPLQNIRLIEIIENASERKEVVIVESMMDNALQFRKLELLFPYLSSERINVKVKSPLADMGGVTLYAIDPLFVFQEHNKALRDACVN